MMGRIQSSSRPVGNGASLVAVKTANETVNNTATVQADDELTLSLEANTTYLIDGFVVYNSGTTPDIRFAFTVPTGSTLNWNVLGLLTNVATTDGSARFSANTNGTEKGIAGTGASDAVAYIRGTITTGGTAGSLTLRWAQAVAEASDTTVKAGSYLKAEGA